MATTKFVLSKSQSQKKNNSNLSMLMLRYSHQKEVTYFTTTKNIDDGYWDGKRQKVKRSCPGSDRLNIFINIIKQKVEDICNGILIDGGNPTTTMVKNYTMNRSRKTKRKPNSLFLIMPKNLLKCQRSIKRREQLKPIEQQ